MSFERIVGLQVIDEVEYQKYRDGMEPILNAMGGFFAYDFRISEVLRSKSKNNINRLFSIEFPSREVMEEFFSNPDYLQIQQQHFADSVESKTLISLHEKSE